MEFTQSYFENLLAQTILFLPKLAVAIVVFVLSLYVAKLAQKWVTRMLRARNTDPELSILLSRSARWIVITFGTVVALQQVNFDVSGFIAGLGIVGFALSFAFQDIAKNFIAGVLLLVQQPFDIGDGIEVAGVGGAVTDIEIRSTTLRTWDGKHIIIPNADVYAATITNFSRSPRRRIEIEIGVAYDTDLDKASAVLLETVSGLPGTLNDPAPQVVFKTFADSSINATVYFWIETATIGLFDAQDQAVKAIKAAFEREGIEIPYPVQTVLLQK